MEHILKLIQEGKTKLALKDFIGFLDEIKEIDKSARIIHGNHKELENQKIEGTIEENETTLINKINKRIINLHEELESLIQSRFEVHKIEISEESFLERLRTKLSNLYTIEAHPLGEGNTSIIYKAKGII